MAANIIIMPRDRLAWHNQMASDLALSHVGFRVAVVIGSFFNSKTGRTHVGYDTLAKELAISRATVGRAIFELNDLGHIAVTSGGGRKFANEYQMIFKSVSPVRRIENRNRLKPETVTTSQTVSNSRVNRLTGETTTLASSSKKNSSRARDLGNPELEALWRGVCERLSDGLGCDLFAAWFAGATPEELGDDGTVAMSVPNKLIRDRIDSHHSDMLLACWRAQWPDAKRVTVIVRSGARRREVAS